MLRVLTVSLTHKVGAGGGGGGGGFKGGWGYWIWQAVEEVAWQHMQVGLTDFGRMRSRSSSSGISSNR